MAYGLRSQAVGKQMKAASREGARTVVLIGPDEVARGVVVVRDMASGEQHETPIGDLR